MSIFSAITNSKLSKKVKKLLLENSIDLNNEIILNIVIENYKNTQSQSTILSKIKKTIAPYYNKDDFKTLLLDQSVYDLNRAISAKAVVFRKEMSISKKLYNKFYEDLKEKIESNPKDLVSIYLLILVSTGLRTSEAVLPLTINKSKNSVNATILKKRITKNISSSCFKRPKRLHIKKYLNY